MILYYLLGLEDWHVSTRAVRSAWRHTALAVHPDQAAEGEREAATTKMQHVNAAREVLLSAARRRQYHVDGVLPWAV
jgi:curved DNA-binding protein CbpA